MWFGLEFKTRCKTLLGTNPNNPRSLFKYVDVVAPTKPKLTRTIKKVIKSPKLLSKGCKNFKKRQPPNDPNLKN